MNTLKTSRCSSFRGLLLALSALAMAQLSFFPATVRAAETKDQGSYDLVIYGPTSAGVIAAVQAKKMGKTAIIVGPDKHLGGLSAGGLGWTDTGNKDVIGGLAHDFYHRIWQEYQKPETWEWQKKEEYGGKGQGTEAVDSGKRTMWIFEPSVAEKVYEDYIKEFDIPVHREEFLDRENGVEMDGAHITAITMLSGKRYSGKMFMDATYEGDLMAAAGVDYHVGREANSDFDEEWNGVQTGVLHHKHHFGAVAEPISPYKVPGDPNSGVLARISTEDPGEYGQGDHRVQAYCFRMCLTDHPENRIPFEAPEGYDPEQYELLIRIFDAGWDSVFGKFDPIPNHKTDTNNHGPFSTDNIGYNYDYPDASYEERAAIIKEHETYQKGWLYFIATDPRVPKAIQEEMNRWGLPKDEFTDNGNWSHQLYIREARRMMGDYVMTQNELQKKRPTPDSVGMGSYSIDSHNTQRYITPEGYVQNEGDIGVSTYGPYEIAYGSLVPKKEQGENLLVPVCVSSTHIAFGSIRMEPVFMILGQSAATAAVMAIDGDLAVQDVPYEDLKAKLKADGQILHYDGPIHTGGHRTGVKVEDLDGIVIDDNGANFTGLWQTSAAAKKFVAFQYRHDAKAGDGNCTATFQTTVPKAGKYEVRLGYPQNGNRAKNVPVEIHHASGTATVEVDQTKTPPHEGLFLTLGTYEFTPDTPASVVITNKDTNGYVVIDAVQFLPVDE